MGTPAAKYDAFIGSLAAYGVHAASFDLRGHGASSSRADRHTDFSYSTLINQDLVAALNALSTVFPTQKIVLSGHSLGGQIAALYLARYGHREVCGLSLLASCTVDYRGWSGARKLSTLVFTQLAYLVARVIGHFPGRRLGFASREARSVMRDWAYNARSGRYNLLDDPFDYELGLTKISTAILAINFSDDTFAPMSATQRLLDKFSPQARCDRLDISAGQMAVSKAGHFTFLRHPDVVASQIARWVKTL